MSPASEVSPEAYRGVDVGWILVPVLEPRMFIYTPHKHDFHQFFCFLGSAPLDIRKFDAEIEVYLGEEGEKHTIFNYHFYKVRKFIEPYLR